jgi:hypothetical protein
MARRGSVERAYVVSAIAKPDLRGYKPDDRINLKGLDRG